jgi:uncharacterized OsmC-like protein
VSRHVNRRFYPYLKHRHFKKETTSMKPRFLFVLAMILVLASLTACQPVQPVTAQPETTLATAKIAMQTSNQFGRMLVSARGNHFIVDSVPPLGHPAEEMNPLEAMLAALATCGLFIHETASIEQGIELTHADALVQADWDSRGLMGEPFSPHMQQIRVHLNLEGPTAEQIDALEAEFMSRCPIYTTLVRATDILITQNDETMGGPVAEGLAMGQVHASLTNEAGRAIVAMRTNYVVIDSVPPLGSPSEETNSLDVFLAAPVTCGAAIMEKIALDEGLPLTNVAATVEADLDPRGVKGQEVSPHVQAMRIHWMFQGIDDTQAEEMVATWMTRCPIYTTLIKATDITVTQEVVDGDLALR